MPRVTTRRISDYDRDNRRERVYTSRGTSRTTEFTTFHPPFYQPMHGPAEYFLMARSNRDTRKSSLDLVIDDGAW